MLNSLAPFTLDLYRPAHTEFRAAHILCYVHTYERTTSIWVAVNDVIQYLLWIGRACVHTQAFWSGLNDFASYLYDTHDSQLC